MTLCALFYKYRCCSPRGKTVIPLVASEFVFSYKKKSGFKSLVLQMSVRVCICGCVCVQVIVCVMISIVLGIGLRAISSMATHLATLSRRAYCYWAGDANRSLKVLILANLGNWWRSSLQRHCCRWVPRSWRPRSGVCRTRSSSSSAYCSDVHWTVDC